MSAFVDQFFTSSNQVKAGGIVRRSSAHVDKRAALPEVIERAKKNGWHVIETGDQIVLMAHPGELIIHC